MRILAVILIVFGVLIAVVTPFALYYLAALGCAMNTTGCRNFSIDWVPFIGGIAIPGLIGFVLIRTGLRIIDRKSR